MVDHSFDNVRQLLGARVGQHPEKDFLFSESSGRVFSYAEFDSAVNHAAALLVSSGARKGERVSLLLTNSVEYLIFYFACFKIGAWAGPVNALLKPQEIEFIIGDSESAIVVTQPDLYARLTRTPRLRTVIVIDGDQPLEKAEQAISEITVRHDLPAADQLADFRTSPRLDAEITIDSEAVIIYTSGTTGKPKGVLLTHGNLMANAEQISDWLRLTPDDRSLLIMPLFHVNALMTTCLAALWAGASVVLAPRFSASRHWETISTYKVSYFGSVATMLSLLNQTYPEGVPAGSDISSLRFALCGSAPVPVEVMKRFESLFACPVIEGYGLSESTCRSTFNPTDERRRVGSVGLPIGNEVKVFDDDDRELGPGEVGEIVLRGPNIMKGYFHNEAATREAFRSGWFHTGDLGYRDADGFFYIVDRKSDMIIRGGENIYPREIDEVLYQHPNVKDAATIGVPDALFGEEVKSFVVLAEGRQATEQELLDFCRERLADFKCPKSIEFLDDIPKGPTGKLLKRELQG
ncbi:MAG TPA: long-chain fatty acid--CoA ligase [Blastocatellia bacterium]|nr:long-chain fatty acid--CoA ligase [Blastocatellia bacterium]